MTVRTAAVLVPVSHSTGYPDGENVRPVISVKVVSERKKELRIAPDVERNRRRVGVAFSKFRTSVPIGAGYDVLTSISIDISETRSLAEKLLGQNKPTEAVQGLIRPNRGLRQEEEEAQECRERSLQKRPSFFKNQKLHHEVLARKYPEKAAEESRVSHEYPKGSSSEDEREIDRVASIAIVELLV